MAEYLPLAFGAEYKVSRIHSYTYFLDRSVFDAALLRSAPVLCEDRWYLQAWQCPVARNRSASVSRQCRDLLLHLSRAIPGCEDETIR